MPFEFGSTTPTAGDQFTYSGKTYKYNGTYWAASWILPDVARQFYFLNALAILEDDIESALYVSQSQVPIPSTFVQITYL